MTIDDDLDTFFDEVSVVVSEVKAEENKEDDELFKLPPGKKLKRPLGVVVAASSSKVVPLHPPTDDIAAINTELRTETRCIGEKYISVSLPEVKTTLSVFSSKALEPTHLPSSDKDSGKIHLCSAAGRIWKDHSLSDWPEDDYRLFVGNLSKDVNDPELYDHFAKYSSLQMVKVIRDQNGLSKGYGFVSLLEPMDCAKAMREMDQSWLSSRPIKVKRSDWKDRELKNVKKKKRQHHRKINRTL
mmetsp:Transcript_16140/g.18634  ORF Transcript_16140/g.18634 Transcript_16140/m.18634 type:complete len:243 (+) Transcript_16140:31-759(+)